MVKIKSGLKLSYGEAVGRSCGSGGYTPVLIVDEKTGKTVWAGVTCLCGRGCGNHDCVRDDWGYHDTDIEEFREGE